MVELRTIPNETMLIKAAGSLEEHVKVRWNVDFPISYLKNQLANWCPRCACRFLKWRRARSPLCTNGASSLDPSLRARRNVICMYK